MGNGVARALAAGINGFIHGTQMKTQMDADAEDRAQKKSLGDIQLRQAQEGEADRRDLRLAAAPVSLQEGAGGATLPASADNRDVGQPDGPSLENGGLQPGVRVGDQSFADPAQGKMALAQANTEEGSNARVATELRRQGKPMEAMKFKSEAQDYADKHWNGKVRDAMIYGHSGLAKVMTDAQGGMFKGKDVVAVPSEDGKNVTYSIKNPDGTVTPTPYVFSNDQNGIVQAGYKLSQVNPETRYRNMVEEDKRAQQQSNKERELEFKGRDVETRGMLADAKMTLADAKAARGADGTSREERLRYTTMFSDAGRQLQQANKDLSKMQGDVLFMAKAKDPNSQEARDLSNKREEIQQFKDDRGFYGGLLGGPSATKARAEGASTDAGKGAGPTSVATPQSRADYDKLPPGTRYRHPDGTVKIKGGAPSK